MCSMQHGRGARNHNMLQRCTRKGRTCHRLSNMKHATCSCCCCRVWCTGVVHNAVCIVKYTYMHGPYHRSGDKHAPTKQTTQTAQTDCLLLGYNWSGLDGYVTGATRCLCSHGRTLEPALAVVCHAPCTQHAPACLAYAPAATNWYTKHPAALPSLTLRATKHQQSAGKAPPGLHCWVWV